MCLETLIAEENDEMKEIAIAVERKLRLYRWHQHGEAMMWISEVYRQLGREHRDFLVEVGAMRELAAMEGALL